MLHIHKRDHRQGDNHHADHNMRQIQLQFLIESFLLSLIGGITGILLGLLLSLALSNVLGTVFRVSADAIILGFGFSAAIGIVFGWAPARKASKLNPIDALRSM